MNEEFEKVNPCGVSQNKDSDTVLVPFWAIDLLKYIKQKLSADKVTVLQSRDELKYLIDCICNASITNKQAVDIYQKLNKKLETNHNYN